MPTYTFSDDNLKDTTLNANQPDNNNGAFFQTNISWNSGVNTRMIFSVDISDIPITEKVVSAQLRLESIGATNIDDAKVRCIIQPGYTEMGATWNKYDGVTDWETPGGDFRIANEVDFTIPDGAGEFIITNMEGLFTPDVMAVKKIILILMGEDESGLGGVAAYSSEESIGSRRPVLTIETDFVTPRRGTTYVQTDTAAAVGAIAACSGLDVAAGADARKAIKGGSVGSSQVAAVCAKAATQACFMYEITPDHATAWLAGCYIVRFKTGDTIENGDITPAGQSLRLDEVHICTVNSSGSSPIILGSVTNLDEELFVDTEYGAAIPCTSFIHNPNGDTDDRVYIVIGIKNTASLDSLTVTMVPELNIETPIIDLSETSLTSPTSTGSPEDDWNFGGRLTASDDSRSTSSVQTDKEDTDSYGFSFDDGAQIFGIEVTAEGRAAGDEVLVESAELKVRLSWDGGTTYTNAIDLQFFADEFPFDPDETKTYGSPDNNWGHFWVPSDLTDANFRAQIEHGSDSEGGDFFGASGRFHGIDALKVNVYYLGANNTVHIKEAHIKGGAIL